MESGAGSRGSSSAWRLTAGATSRLTESLLSSGGAVAAVGLVTAVLTLGFAVWLGLELRYQSAFGVPLARSAAAMNDSLNQSLAALRGWVAYGLETSLEERTRVWTTQIEPTHTRLERLARGSGDDHTIQRVGELREVLRELKLVQWAIEDVAQTPGNQPARVAYDRILGPLRSIVLKSFGSAMDQFSTAYEGERAVDFIVLLARFRSSFNQADLALSTHIIEFSGAGEHAARQHLERARMQASQIQSDAVGMVEGDVAQILEFGLEEFGAYELEAQKILALRRSAARNVAQLLFVREAKSLVTRARAISSELADTHARAMAEHSESLARASYLVIAMALMMGLLSGGSLLVSFRLRQQVHNVLEKVKVLGQYEIEHLIGKGGMGAVYLAHHAMLRRPTAIKLMRSRSAQDMRAQNRFQREVQLTSQLTHPNTIEIFDYGRTPEGIFYYAMEYVEGFTLASLVSLAGPVDPSRVIHTLVQACGSLHEAHERGLLHRDIKPTNIMLTQRGGIYDTVKILDFGLVKDLSGDSVDDQIEEEMIVGTPMYLAPETILSAQSTSPRSDLYALGAVAYFMLSGKTLFEKQDVLEILAQQVEEDPPFPSERLGRALPEDLEYVVMSCLAKDPSDRPASAAHLAELLLACDCPEWTARDASHWWEVYGEAARNVVTTKEILDSADTSQLEVVVTEPPS